MKYVSRTDQTRAGVTIFSTGHQSLSDDLLDTARLPRPTNAVRWLRETTVHSGLCITESLRNTNQFLTNQTTLVRDEVRQVTWVISLETEGLYLSRVENTKLVARTQLAPGEIVRATLTVRKFDGAPIVTYIRVSNGISGLYVNGVEVPTSVTDVDFPCIWFEQPPIGYAATEAPTNGLLTYKSKSNAQAFVRRIDPQTLTVDPEVLLSLPPILGGVAVAISNGLCVGKIEVIDGGKVKPATITSHDYFATQSSLSEIDLSAGPVGTVIPGTSRLFVDAVGVIHVSVAVANLGVTTLLDVQLADDLLVAAVVGKEGTSFAIEAFPKKPLSYTGLRDGYGDGKTDGAGVIATLLSDGRLFAANSQSGGYTYPDSTLLNDDMQKMYVHAQTECYTRDRPNYVSMDYAFVEADESNAPVSSSLWLETWDMPLPEPTLTHEWDGDRLKLKINQDGWFFPGQTMFTIRPAIAEITRVDFADYREMHLEFNAPSRVRGTEVTFETRNVFYFHRAAVIV